jgi:hypothetical protein
MVLSLEALDENFEIVHERCPWVGVVASHVECAPLLMPGCLTYFVGGIEANLVHRDNCEGGCAVSSEMDEAPAAHVVASFPAGFYSADHIVDRYDPCPSH